MIPHCVIQFESSFSVPHSEPYLGINETCMMELFAKIVNGCLKFANYSRKNFHQICLKRPYIRPWYFSLFEINTKFYAHLSMKLRIYPILGKKDMKTMYLDLFNTVFSSNFSFLRPGLTKQDYDCF